MSQTKKQVRANFRDAVFSRDNFCCQVCLKDVTQTSQLDAHHITDRSLMPAGGYVRENGITLCAQCHERAEVYHQTGIAHPGYSPDDLYTRIGSSYPQALRASEELSRGVAR